MSTPRKKEVTIQSSLSDYTNSLSYSIKSDKVPGKFILIVEDLEGNKTLVNLKTVEKPVKQ